VPKRKDVMDAAKPLGVGRKHPREGQQRDVSMPQDCGLQAQHLVEIDRIPAAEGALAHGLPEVALGKRRAAAAELAAGDAGLPHVAQLAHRDVAVDLGQHVRQEGRAAAAPAAHVQHL